MEISKDRIEIFVDDRDMRALLDGKEVGMVEAGVNDQRPIVLKRWQNPEIKYKNSDRDLKAVELLTGQKFDRFKRNVPSGSLGVDTKPFEEVPHAPEFGQNRPVTPTGEKTGSNIPGSVPAGQRSDSDLQGGREGQNVPYRS